jgi:ADP-ribose pyrophosphatase
MPIEPWKTLSSRLIYQNPWMKVREDIAEMPDGRTTIYGVVSTADAVGVLPFVDNDHVVLVRQYRYVFGEDHRWEIPTGGSREGESLIDAARRELREEIGFNARELEHIHTFFSSKSVVNETAHLYIGRGLEQVRAEPDETEFLEVRTFPFDEVFQMVLRSEIRDAMSVIAVLLAAPKICNNL